MESLSNAAGNNQPPECALTDHSDARSSATFGFSDWAVLETSLPAWNLFLLIFGLVASVTNLFPFVVLPFVLAVPTLALQLLCRVICGKRVLTRTELRPVWPFALFVTASFIYATLIGVDVTNPALYRREFKYFFSFGWLVVFALLHYPMPVGAKWLKRALIFMGFFAVAWYVVGRINPAFLLSRYPTSAAALGMWEYYRQRTDYLGSFLNHDSLGAFLASMAILLANLARGRQWSIALVLAWACTIFLDLSASRSFIVGALGASGWSLIVDGFFVRLPRRRRFRIVAHAGIAVIALIGALPAFVTVASVVSRALLTSESRGTLKWPTNELETLSARFSLALPPSVPASALAMLNNRLSKMLSPRPPTAIIDAGESEAAIDAGESEAAVQTATARSRIFLAHIALGDFLGSPIIGVGAARFDNDPRVLSTILGYGINSRTTEHPTIVGELYDNPDELGYLKRGTVRFLDVPLFHINVGSFIAHIDEQAHDSYLTVLAEGGIVFFALFLFMYFRLYQTLGVTQRATDGTTLGDLALGARRLLICVAIASATTDSMVGVLGVLYAFSVASFVLSVSRPAES
jgi:hypothetical protein